MSAVQQYTPFKVPLAVSRDRIAAKAFKKRSFQHGWWDRPTEHTTATEAAYFQSGSVALAPNGARTEHSLRVEW